MVLLGVGGQGLLTIAELLAEAAFREGVPVLYYPTPGMAQRGGLVQAQVRLGREAVGPRIPEGRAHLVIALEVAEALRGVRYLRSGGEFVLYGEVWAPTAVLLGKVAYPTPEEVRARIGQMAGKVLYLEPGGVPRVGAEQMPGNLFALGAAVGGTELGEVVRAAAIGPVIQERWRDGARLNLLAFQAGLRYAAGTGGGEEGLG